MKLQERLAREEGELSHDPSLRQMRDESPTTSVSQEVNGEYQIKTEIFTKQTPLSETDVMCTHIAIALCNAHAISP